MNCRRVYFYIRSQCGGNGWTTDTAKEAFEKDICSLFAKDGWTIAVPGSSGACHMATTSDGDGELYLHPLVIDGYVKEDSISHIEEVLRNGATFRYEGNRVAGIVYDKNDEEYRVYLDSKREEIRQFLIERLFPGVRKRKGATADMLEYKLLVTVRKFRLERKSSYGGVISSSDMDWVYIEGILHQMVSDGEIVKRNNEYYLAAKKRRTVPQKPARSDTPNHYRIVTKAGVFDVIEAESAEDALCDFAATMDLDMHQYFEAIPVTEESTGKERAAADADRHGAETGQETE